MVGRSCPVMVGRADQLAVLQEAFKAAGQGGYRAVPIGGEAGAGKSRLIAEFTAEVTTVSATGTGPARVLAGGRMSSGCSMHRGARADRPGGARAAARSE